MQQTASDSSTLSPTYTHAHTQFYSIQFINVVLIHSNRQPPVSNHLVIAGKKISLSTGRNMRQNQAQGGEEHRAKTSISKPGARLAVSKCLQTNTQATGDQDTTEVISPALSTPAAGHGWRCCCSAIDTPARHLQSRLACLSLEIWLTMLLLCWAGSVLAAAVCECW